MNNFEHIKSINNSADLAHEICNAIENIVGEDIDGCEVCPVRKDCYEGHNAIQAYLMMEHR